MAEVGPCPTMNPWVLTLINFLKSESQNVQMMLFAHYVQYLLVSRNHIDMYMYSKTHFMICVY